MFGYLSKEYLIEVYLCKVKILHLFIMINKIVGYLLAGLVIVLPIALTVWVVYYLISTVQLYFNITSALVGLIVIIFFLIFIGFLTTKFIDNIFWTRVENFIIKTPFFGLVYKALKDITTAVVGRENKFSEPVMVDMHNEIYKIGFVTNTEINLLFGDIPLSQDIDKEMYLVYFPLSFSLSGDLYLVPRNRIKPIQAKAKDVMQTIVTGGIIKLD